MTRRGFFVPRSLGFSQIALSHLLAQTSDAPPVPIYQPPPRAKGPLRRLQSISATRLTGLHGSGIATCHRIQPPALCVQASVESYPPDVKDPGTVRTPINLRLGAGGQKPLVLILDIERFRLEPLDHPPVLRTPPQAGDSC